jgi:hypothetical protein
MLFVVFAVDINNPDGACYLLSSRVEKECLPAPSTAKDNVVLSSGNIGQRPRDIDILDRIAPTSLDADIFLNDSSEVFYFARHVEYFPPSTTVSELL